MKENENPLWSSALCARREGISWDPLDFPDNHVIVDLVGGKPGKSPLGILPMLDEECITTGGSSEGWCSKMQRTHGSNPHFEVVKLRQNNFIVHHFAGDLATRDSPSLQVTPLVIPTMTFQSCVFMSWWETNSQALTHAGLLKHCSGINSGLCSYESSIINAMVEALRPAFYPKYDPVLVLMPCGCLNGRGNMRKT